MEDNNQNPLKVLVLSCEPWDNTNNVGSTLSNFFAGMEGVELANIYYNFGRPNNELEMSCFQITEKSLLQNMLNKNVPSGRVVSKENGASSRNSTEQKGFNILRKLRFQVFFWARELIWRLGRVESGELYDFIDRFAPDAVFIPFSDTVYVQRSAYRLSRKTGKWMCAFIGDDLYSMRRLSFSPLFWIDRLIKRASIRRTVKRCSKVFLMTENGKAEYDKALGIDCGLLTKGLDFDEPEYKDSEVENKLRFVYTGNLYAGRWKSLAELGRTLQRINEENAAGGGRQAELIVYSMTPMSGKMTKAFNVPSIRFMGGAPASEMPAIQKDADVLVHAESMNKRNMLVVRLSFSTKLVDYMHAARCILAIGPSQQSSIAHLIKHDAAVTVTEKDEMYQKVKRLVDDPGYVNEYARKAWRCGAENHQRQVIQQRLYDELQKAAARGK